MSDPLYYTVWTTKDESVVAFGTAAHCAEMLGMRKNDFYSTISRINKGKNKKYEYYSEPLYLEEYAGEYNWWEEPAECGDNPDKQAGETSNETSDEDAEDQEGGLERYDAGTQPEVENAALAQAQEEEGEHKHEKPFTYRGVFICSEEGLV